MAMMSLLDSIGGGQPSAEARVRNVGGHPEATGCTAGEQALVWSRRALALSFIHSFFIKWKQVVLCSFGEDQRSLFKEPNTAPGPGTVESLGLLGLPPLLPQHSWQHMVPTCMVSESRLLKKWQPQV